MCSDTARAEALVATLRAFAEVASSMQAHDGDPIFNAPAWHLQIFAIKNKLVQVNLTLLKVQCVGIPLDPSDASGNP